MPSPPDAQLEQIRTVNHHLRLALNQVEEGVVILGTEPLHGEGPRVYFANRKALELTGLREEELIGAPVGRFYEAEALPELLSKLPRVAAMQRIFETDKLLQDAQGRRIACRWSISAHLSGDGEPLNYTLTFRPLPAAEKDGDTGPRSKPEETLEGLMDKGRMESLALVAMGVAHDFNNVLTTILANLSMAQAALSIRDQVRGPIDHAMAAAEGAQALTDQLLKFAKGSKPHPRELHLGSVLQRASRLALAGSNVSCEFTSSARLWSVKAEETQMMQVFHNLIVNARQAMVEGGVIQAGAINVELGDRQVGSLRAGLYVEVTVRDRGHGIHEVDLPKIFDPFFSRKKNGNGMGLATAMLAVKRHGGTIIPSSKVDVGTEFRIYLPATGEVAHPEPLAGERRGGLQSGKGAVLVVDDQDGVRRVAVDILNSLGYEAIAALSGEEALRLYTSRLHEGQPFSAVLMDMTLPGGMSGSETVREIRRLDPTVRAIATSGYFDADEDELLARREYAGILCKPYTAEALSSAIHTVLSA